ncbi:hypothetical protein ACH5RR_006846 [Cinchona calisaya]|uniref:Uncharacterized protein n=1 Tax=Cinchona calisaya TaxID=153742 RepID=A0ABD3AQ66_9GENT
MRNLASFEDKSFIEHLVINNVTSLLQDISIVYPFTFHRTNTFILHHNISLSISPRTIQSAISVAWQSLSMNYQKFNVDGVSRGNAGEAVGGGVLRYHQGEVLYAFSTFY